MADSAAELWKWGSYAAKVEVVLNAPLRDPIVYKIMDYEVSLRRSEAHMVVVITNEEAEGLISEEYNGTREGDQLHEVIAQSSKRINVALVGNPNSGKTSLFNAISGGHEHVGNYSGVTVDAKRGHCTYRGYRFEITDLPGTYALTAYSPEELYVRRHLAEHTPDVIINAVVASNLERNLYLTTELIDLNPRVVVALNMYDELEASGAELDYDSLGRMLGVPMVPVVARHGRGIEALLDTVIAVYENEDDRVRHIHINQGPVIEESLRTITGALKESGELPPQFPPRYIAMKLLEEDSYIKDQLKHHPKYPEWEEASKREARRIKNLLDEDIETAFADQKYGFISGALRETYTPGKKEQTQVTKIIDAFVTHKLWGFPIFFFLMWLMFYCTFNLGAYPQEWIEQLVGLIGQGVDAWMPDGALKDLLVDGVIGGVGSVIVFLPNIMILYLFIAFMEDSGYLARAAFIMDRIMHRIGLHGKSFIPLIMGFGCNVPAIMATRTIESRKEPAHHRTARPLHVVRRPHSHLYPADRHVLRCLCQLGDARTVSAGNRRGRHHGPADAPLSVQEGRNAVRHGAAALSGPDNAGHAVAHVGSLCAIPAQNGRADSNRFGGGLVLELLSDAGRSRPGRNYGGTL